MAIPTTPVGYYGMVAIPVDSCRIHSIVNQKGRTMNPVDLVNKAFQSIQENKELYRQWCDAKTEEDRTLMLMEAAYAMGYTDGMVGRIRPV